MLPSSGSLSIGQIYQECGGTALSFDEDIQRVRDIWWYADMPATFTVVSDDQNGYASVIGSIVSSHPFRSTPDVDVTYDVYASTFNGYNYEFTQATALIQIPQYLTNTGYFSILYNCYMPYSCFVSGVYTNNIFPTDSGNYVYSTSFVDYYGKTRYNAYAYL